MLIGNMAQLFLNLIGTLFGTVCNINPYGSYPKNYAYKLKDGEVFDFIVAGGGTAGCVVAGRLSENPDWKVLLIEAGYYPTTFTEIPATSIALINSDVDWKYELPSTSDECLIYKENRCRLTRGKVLGGSSSINGMVYVRSPKEDYDNWSQMGNEGWNWDNVLKYFKKAEHFPEDSYYGSQGPVTLHKFQSKNPLTSIIANSFEQAGFNLHNNEENLGLFNMTYNIENGTRCSTAKAYIAKNKNRPNLYIALGVKATKIIFENNVAVRVEVSTSGRVLQVAASKEIIISAGVIGSPQLLMLSGIGPEEHLNSLNISVIKNLRVGKNFHDHISLYVMNEINFTSQSPNYLKDQLTYCQNRTGASFTNEYNINLMFSHNISTPNIPDMHMEMTHFSKLPLKNIVRIGIDNLLQFKSTPTNSIADYASKSDLLFYRIYLGTPKFRGEILLRSNDHKDQPLIHPRLLSNEEDIQKLKQSISVLKQVMATPAMVAIGAKFIDLKLENCSSVDYDSDDYLNCYIRNVAGLYLHCAGTCKMGTSSDISAVVDPRLRVHGIQRLRVVDGSIMPTVVNRNLHAPIIMIAEKASDMIKEDNAN